MNSSYHYKRALGGTCKSTLMLLLFAFLFSNISQAQQKKAAMTALDVARVQSVGDVAFAPGGNKVAYTLRVQADPLEENEPATYELHLLDLLTGSSTPYMTTMSVSSVSFRPGHNTITFLGRRNDNMTTALYEMPLQGGEAQKLFGFKTSIADYDWASDGDRLAFMATEPRREEPSSTLPYEPEIYEENLRQRRGYVTDVTEEHPSLHRVRVEGSIYQMHWSPGANKIALAVAPTPLIDDYYMHQQVKIVDRHGKEVLGAVDHRGKLGQIDWSPDGNFLAMIAGADIHDPIAGRLFVVSAGGGKPNNLKPDFHGMFEQFQWVDNNTLHYIASESVWSSYGKINKNGSGMETIIGNGIPILTGFSRSANGTVAFVGDAPSHPAEVFVMKKRERSLKRMTNTNPWLENIAMGRQEAVSWKARDGKKLEGVLVYPTDYEKGKTYPLITEVHGGPESHYDNGWLTNYSQPGQLGAGKGYFVFYPNYRGSTGRGEAFLKSSQGDPAGAEFDDIVDGVDRLIDAGYVDSTKVGVTGGSYGGYATGWMATRYTDRFAAGVMFVGISDNISKWGTSDIPEELYLVHARKRIWEDYRFFLERSPIFHAGQADTPLLILAGKEDTRVDPGQSYELYRHIKTRTDTPVRLVLYPGEGHGNRKATARLDYTLRMMRWFDRYLKGENPEQRPDSEIEPTDLEIE